MSAATGSTWLGRNRWFLVALVVLLPAAFFVALGAGWFAYAESVAGKPIVARGGDTVEYAGSQWSLLESHSFDAESDAGEAAGLLPGTSLVTATVGVRPGAQPTSCEFELADATGSRTWNEASFSDADFDIADGTENYCDSAAEAPYRVQVFFVVPDDSVDSAQLRLSYYTSLPEFIAFQL